MVDALSKLQASRVGGASTDILMLSSISESPKLPSATSKGSFRWYISCTFTGSPDFFRFPARGRYMTYNNENRRDATGQM